MKAVQKIMASALALTMAASAGIGALADNEPIKTNGGAASVPVAITAEAPTTFSVKVPSSLPLTIKADGSVEVPTNLQIENDSAGPVKVTKIEATKGSWGLAAFGSNFDAMSVNAEKLGFKLNDATTIDSTDNTQTLANFKEADWTIGGNKKLPITVAADASAVSEAVENASAASVIFTIAWDAADGTEATTPPSQTSEPTPTADPTPTPTLEYTVTFVTGEGSAVDSQQVEEGKTAARPTTDPTRDGYTFGGWYADENYGTEFNFSTPITAATTVYAKWTEVQTVTHVDENHVIQDSWEEIIAACSDGTYENKYSVGDKKLLDLGAQGEVYMQIVAFNADTLASDSSKTAPITWISEQLLKKHNMTATNINEGGWEASEMRSYINNTIKPLIPETVRSAIKAVTKTNNKGGDTTDYVWIPSKDEVIRGGAYTGFFTGANSRVKKVVGASSATWWWLRTADDNDWHYYYVDSNGGFMSNGGSDSRGVALGFCT